MTALTSVVAVRAGVVALREERLRGLDPEGGVYALQAEALDAVLRIIDTGHWRTPEELARLSRVPTFDPVIRQHPVTAWGQVDRETALVLGLAEDRDAQADLDARTAAALADTPPPRSVLAPGDTYEAGPVVVTVSEPPPNVPVYDDVHGPRSMDAGAP